MFKCKPCVLLDKHAVHRIKKIHGSKSKIKLRFLASCRRRTQLMLMEKNLLLTRRPESFLSELKRLIE